MSFLQMQSLNHAVQLLRSFYKTVPLVLPRSVLMVPGVGLNIEAKR